MMPSDAAGAACIHGSDEVMLRWGALVGRLELAGRTVAAIDSLIAAIALEGDDTLATRNQRDVQGTGVRTINPWSS